MFVTADQLVLHAVGDYVLQSDWMAQMKTKAGGAAACAVHVALYTAPFLTVTTSWRALLFIAASHFVIDRWRLAKYVCWAKNGIAPRWLTMSKNSEGETFVERPAQCQACRTCAPGKCSAFGGTRVRNWPLEGCQKTGYPPTAPDFMAVWLMIIADNVMHVLCNAAAVRWL